MSVKENILRIRKQIDTLCQKIARNPKEITLVAVIKEAETGQIQEAIASGLSDLGINKVQDASKKYADLANSCCFVTALSWHMIGHLQSNKVKDAVKIFDLIHSVDSLYLAEKIDKEASKLNKVQDILIQVNTSGEKTKFGAKPDEAIEVIKGAVSFKNLRIKGLMTIAPMVDSHQRTRPYFKMLRELRDEINHLTNNQLTVLSMGMTQDYEVAVEEGSTMIRLGRAIFEA